MPCVGMGRAGLNGVEFNEKVLVIYFELFLAALLKLHLIIFTRFVRIFAFKNMGQLPGVQVYDRDVQPIPIPQLIGFATAHSLE